MAGEIGHVVYGQRIATFLDDAVEKLPDFWSGTLFPDIRHLGVVSRHHTHPADVTLKSLAGETDFATGMRAHSWLDATREEWLSQQHVKELLPWHPFVPHGLKLLEDELLYDRFEDWDGIRRVLHTVQPLEQELVQDTAAIERWHVTLRDYFVSAPTDETRIALSERIGLSSAVAQEINSIVGRLRKNEVAAELVTAFSAHLDRFLK